MTLLKLTLLATASLLLVAIVFGVWVHSRNRAQMRSVWTTLEGARETDPPRYSLAMVADLPEVAQR